MYRGGLFMVAGLLFGLVLFFGTRDFAVSAGVATMSPETDNSAQFVEDANAAMNEAKANGRNCVHAA